ncbi:YlaF family protein [Robertmurraya andreesenii]|uniref:Hydrogenase/urease accessory protein HupE n=1 Tax=Anoxybacillus andreesenii TaxID=1325932 RepID=A0ABT9V4J5_9BACL|nr:YlaF family protein [Robertmurraya andreesenii]MDQ0155863.1 hydrogenase/urease accessory protein HupE [Robertmurraya andreesenii]
MRGIKWPFLCLALAATLSMMGIGIAIGVRSPLWIAVTLFAFISVMGLGFMTKRKMREKGNL